MGFGIWDSGPGIYHVAFMPPSVAIVPGPWYRTITPEQWRVLAAAKFGWMLDAMDFMLYAVAINQLRAYFGFSDATAGLLTTAEPRHLLASLQDIERRLGKTPPAVRWGPRVIDLDLLVLGDLRVAEVGLVLPHPDLHRRNFVLYPLAEIAAELQVPGLGRVSRLLEGVPAAGIERLAARGSGDD